MQERRADSRGFSMVEVCIALAIVALAAAVVIPAMNNVTRADLRSSASLTAAVMRSAYAQSALTGLTHRLIFVAGKNTIAMESTEEALHFDDKTGAMVSAAEDLAALNAVNSPFADDPDTPAEADAHKGHEEANDLEALGGGMSNGPLSAMLGINKLAQRSAKTAYNKVEAWQLKGSVHVLDVWTDGMTSALTEGEAYIYFFSGGYTQEALIHLEDNERRVFTVKLQPLTGKSEIIAEYVEVPK